MALNLELKKTQLDILRRFSIACADYNITSFAYYGTLIGAIRHKGYIPWDDDIDMAVLRKGYNKLKEVDWKKYDLALLMPGYENGSPYLVAKIYDPSTRLNENMDNKVDFLGVNIDVFPIDYMDDRRVMGALKQLVISFFKSAVLAKNIKVSRKRGWSRNFILRIGKFILAPLSVYFLTNYLNKLTDSKENGLGKAGAILGVYGGKDIFPASFYSGVEVRVFEDQSILVPLQYDKLLTGIYGDYMTLPPVEERVSHHDFDAFN